MLKLKHFVQHTLHFLRTDIWRVHHSELTRTQVFFLQPLQMFLLTARGYMRDKCALRASALTFYTLLSIVPVMAMAFGVAKGFGLDQHLKTQLYSRFTGQEEVLSWIIEFARTLLENTRGGVVAGIGVVVLLWSAVKVLSNIEGALNDIWKVRARSFIRKFTDYLAIMMISPLLVALSSSVNVFITTQLMSISGKLELLRVASPLIFVFLKLIPYGLIWALFILIYMVMPNTRVRFKSALIAGVLSGTLYQIVQGFYINAQILVAKYNAIYGSFAALPLFLIWLQVSWMIVLLGAQIAYAHQHYRYHGAAMDYQNSGPDFQKRLALYILRFLVKRFEQNESAPAMEEIAHQLRLPFPLVAQSVDQLIECGLVVQIESQSTDEAQYQPAKDINTLTLAVVLAAWDQRGQQLSSEPDSPVYARINQSLEAIAREMSHSSANCLLKDI